MRTCCSKSWMRRIHNFKNVFKKYVDKPMIKCEDFGHSTYNLVLPIGANVVFNADNKKIEIIEEIFN